MAPSTDKAIAAQSLILSTRHYDGQTDRRRTRSELREIGERIKSGVPFDFDSREVDRLLEGKAALERGLAVQDKLRIAVFLLLLLIVPVIAVVLLFLKYLRR